MNTKIAIVLILAVCSLIYLTNIGARDFWAPDEGDFAQIVKELDNNFVVPHLNNTAYGEKPPLFYYVVFAFAGAFHFLPAETSMRLASGFAALVTITAFFFIVLRSFDLNRAVTASVVLALTPLFYWQARYLQVDMVFSTFLVLALFAFFHFAEEKRTVFYYLFFVFLALAFMTKGPLAAALALPVVLIYCASEKKLSVLLSRHTYIGLLLFLAIVIPWYLAVYLREGFPYLYENILRQNYTRFFDAWSHKRPFYYYFTTLPLDFFPWSLFLPLGIYTAFKAWRTDAATRFFLIWFLWFFFFLSLSSGKISKYILPALPALSVIVSGCMTDRKYLYNKIAFPVIAGIFCTLGIVLFFYRTSLYPEFHMEKMIIGLLCLAFGSLTIIACTRFKTLRSAFASVAVLMAIVYMAGNVSIFEKWNLYKSPRPLCEKIRRLAGDHTPWVYYGSLRGVYIYYTGRYAVHIDEHDTAGLLKFAGDQKEFYLLTRKRDAVEVEKAIQGIKTEFEERIGETDMVFFHFSDKT